MGQVADTGLELRLQTKQLWLTWQSFSAAIQEENKEHIAQEFWYFHDEQKLDCIMLGYDSY
jgi:hypothetical protein